MKVRSIVAGSSRGLKNNERTRRHAAGNAPRWWRWPVAAVMGATALGCGDDGAEPGASGQNSTETSPEAGSPATSSTDGGADPTSSERNSQGGTEPAPTGHATSAATNGDTGETAEPNVATVSENDAGGTESANDTGTEGTGDGDGTSGAPIADGRPNGFGASGGLTPAFDLDVHEYDVTLPVFATRLVLTADLAPGGSLRVDGAAFNANGVWTSAPLDVGTTAFTVTWESAEGVVQTYVVNAHRAEPAREYLGTPHDAALTHGANTALSGDGNTLAIGAADGSWQADGPRVYVRSGAEWSLEAHLQHPNPPEGGEGGWILELSADGDTLVAGARSASAAYVFERTANGWALAAELTGQDGDDIVAYSLGDSVAISGDGETIAVGSNRRQSPEGAVYVFQKDASVWKQRARLEPAPIEPSPWDGYCNAFNTELALDAAGKTLAIANGSLIYGCQGSVDVYENTDADWTRMTILPEQELGQTPLDVDLNADGRVLAIAGVEEWAVYTKASRGWVEQARDNRATRAVHLTDSGDTLTTGDAVFLRTSNGWTFETLLPEPKAVRYLSSTGLAMSGDGSTIALGAHVYSTRPTVWTALEEQPAGNTKCEERTHDMAGACLYELACDAERVEATCDVQEDGTWQCGCYGAEQGELREFIVSGGDESTVCRLSATLCVDGNELVGETECSREITPETNACYEQETCVTTFGLDEGVEAASTVTKQTSTCWTDSLGDVYCECGEGYYFEPTTERFAVFGAGAEQTCSLFKGICDGTVAVGQEPHCEEPRVALEEYYSGCTSKRVCGDRTLLDEAGAVYALGNLSRPEVSCDNFNSADECTCGPVNTYGAGLVFVDSTRPETSCLVADAVCFGAVGVEAGEAFECAVTEAELEVEHCRAIADCGLALDFEGTSANATESVEVECTQGADDSWSCDCTRGWNDDYQFSVGAASSAGACDVAAVECAGRGTPLDATQGEP